LTLRADHPCAGLPTQARGRRQAYCERRERHACRLPGASRRFRLAGHSVGPREPNGLQCAQAGLSFRQSDVSRCQGSKHPVNRVGPGHRKKVFSDYAQRRLTKRHDVAAVRDLLHVFGLFRSGGEGGIRTLGRL
jgi:hypothetical protein